MNFPTMAAAMVLLVFGLSASASAAPAALVDDDQLQADTLIAAVMERNSGLAAIRAALQEAAARQDYAGTLDDPELSWDTAPRTLGSTFDRGQVVRISQAIPWPGTFEQQRIQAGHQRQVREYDLEAARLRLAALTRIAWAEWQYLHRALTINEQIDDVLGELRQAVESRLAVDEASQQDVLRVELERSQLQHQRLTLQAELRSIQAQINALLNHSADTPLPPPPTDGAAPPLPALPAATLTGVRDHPRIGRLRARQQANAAEVELARLQSYPRLRFSTGYNSLWGDADQRWTVGVSMTLPLNQEKRRAAVAAAEAKRLESQWQMLDEQSRLQSELLSVHAAAEEQWHAMNLYRERVIPLAEESLSAALADYRSGNADVLAVVDAVEQGELAELEWRRAEADYRRQLANYYRWLGGREQTSPARAGGLQDDQ